MFVSGTFLNNYQHLPLRHSVVNAKEIGRRIRDLRTRLNITQEKLAEGVDISYNYISIVENGRKSASLKTLAKISQKSGVSIDYLVFGKDCDTTLNFSHDEVINDVVNLLISKGQKEKLVPHGAIPFTFPNI